MPKQNRVNPKSQIQAVPMRGAYMGNRGVLHNEEHKIIKAHTTKGWVTCKLNFKNRHREIMAKNRYTELFFLDEVTAFAAGHRPCGECRRDRYNEFKKLWLKANSFLLNDLPHTIKNIDNIIHKERIYKKKQITFRALYHSLPSGAMIEYDENIYLIWDKKPYLWTYQGYESVDIDFFDKDVTVLTPRSYIRTFSLGFVPKVHPSLDRHILKGGI